VILLGDEIFGGGSSHIFTKKPADGSPHRSNCLEKNRSWKDDLYDYRNQTIELLFQRIIQALGLNECQVKGEGRNGAFVLASVWLYQACYITNYREGKPLVCIKD
jgi:hypothetical protein